MSIAEEYIRETEWEIEQNQREAKNLRAGVLFLRWVVWYVLWAGGVASLIAGLVVSTGLATRVPPLNSLIDAHQLIWSVLLVVSPRIGPEGMPWGWFIWFVWRGFWLWGIDKLTANMEERSRELRSDANDAAKKLKFQAAQLTASGG